MDSPPEKSNKKGSNRVNFRGKFQENGHGQKKALTFLGDLETLLAGDWDPEKCPCPGPWG